MSDLYWFGCYRDVRGGDGLFTGESTGHPAKMAGGLLFRILDEAERRGWFRRGMALLDPFYGVGTTGLARLRAYAVLGVELEQYWMDTADGCDCTGVSKADWLRYFQPGTDRRRRHRANYRDGRHWCPRCLALAYEPCGATLFGEPATVGVIPSTGSHHYEGNRELLERLAGAGIGRCSIVQGDSRDLGALLGTDVPAAVTSPPYGGLQQGAYHCYDYTRYGGGGQLAHPQVYGFAPGQIENLPDPSTARLRASGEPQPNPSPKPTLRAGGVVTSPPYGGRDGEPHRSQPADEWRGDRRWGGPNSVVRAAGYGSSQGQIGNLSDPSTALRVGGAVTSPPYANTEVLRCGPRNWREEFDEHQEGSWRQIGAGCGDTDGQIGRLPDGAVTSPPWEDSEGSLTPRKFTDVVRFAQGIVERDAGSPARHSRSVEATAAQFERQSGYGDSTEQIGRLTGETYQDAMLAVYRSMRSVLAPGAVAAVVVKCPTRNWCLRRLDVDTWRLLQAAGFECWCPICQEWVAGEPHDHPDVDRGVGPLCGYRAVLAKELARPDLFGSESTRLVGRVTFFKRHWHKQGQPTALWEDVLFARCRPSGLGRMEADALARAPLQPVARLRRWERKLWRGEGRRR